MCRRGRDWRSARRICGLLQWARMVHRRGGLGPMRVIHKIVTSRLFGLVAVAAFYVVVGLVLEVAGVGREGALLVVGASACAGGIYAGLLYRSRRLSCRRTASQR